MCRSKLKFDKLEDVSVMQMAGTLNSCEVFEVSLGRKKFGFIFFTKDVDLLGANEIVLNLDYSKGEENQIIVRREAWKWDIQEKTEKGGFQ